MTDRFIGHNVTRGGTSDPGASIAVYEQDGVTLAQIVDEAGTVTANPITADQYGQWSFGGSNGIYQVEVTFTNGGVKWIRDIELGGGGAVAFLTGTQSHPVTGEGRRGYYGSPLYVGNVSKFDSRVLVDAAFVFNKSVPTTEPDLMPGGNDATKFGTFEAVSGDQTVNALQFNGTDSYLNLDNAYNNAMVSADYLFASIVYRTTDTGPNGENILLSGHTDSNRFRFAPGPNGGVYFRGVGGSNTQTNTHWNLNNGSWQHNVMVINKVAGTASIYGNRYNGSGTLDFSTGEGTFFLTDMNHLSVGQEYDGFPVTSDFFTGDIDSVFFWTDNTLFGTVGTDGWFDAIFAYHGTLSDDLGIGADGNVFTTVSQKSVPIMYNHSFEENASASGPIGWFAARGNTFTPSRQLSGGSWWFDPPGIRDGDRFIYPVSNPLSEVNCKCDISAFAPEIDASSLKITFDVYIVQASADRCTVEIQFWSDEPQYTPSTSPTGTTVGSTLSGQGPASTTTIGFLITGEGTIPVGARWVSVRLLSTRSTGSSNDAMFDDCQITIENV